MGALEDPGGLLADLVERPLHHRLAQLTPLELGYEHQHLLHELVDGVAFIAAHGERELAVRDPSVALRLKRDVAWNSVVSESAMS